MLVFPRVLLVDDDDRIRSHIKRLIRHLCPTVTISEATNGEEALEQYAYSGADIIVTDDAMPVLDGPAFIAQVRRRNSNVPIVLISHDPLAAERVHPGGATYYVAKRMVFKELAAALNPFVDAEMGNSIAVGSDQ